MMVRWTGAIAAGALVAALMMSGGEQGRAVAEETKTAIFAGGCF
jgi:hypothetical protein